MIRDLRRKLDSGRKCVRASYHDGVPPASVLYLNCKEQKLQNQMLPNISTAENLKEVITPISTFTVAILDPMAMGQVTKGRGRFVDIVPMSVGHPMVKWQMDARA